jgi:hypothetical protein
MERRNKEIVDGEYGEHDRQESCHHSAKPGSCNDGTKEEKEKRVREKPLNSQQFWYQGRCHKQQGHRAVQEKNLSSPGSVLNLCLAATC